MRPVCRLTETGIEGGKTLLRLGRDALDEFFTALELADRRRDLAAIRLDDPSEYEAAASVTPHEAAQANWEELRALARETEIDFTELSANVNEMLSTSTRPSVGDVLIAHPATQGVASVVGLLSLASDFGQIDDETERLTWVASDGNTSSALVAIHRFTERLP